MTTTTSPTTDYRLAIEEDRNPQDAADILTSDLAHRLSFPTAFWDEAFCTAVRAIEQGRDATWARAETFRAYRDGMATN